MWTEQQWQLASLSVSICLQVLAFFGNFYNILTVIERTVERLIESESGYKNVRTIWLRVEPIPSAFIYVFEFSVLSAERPIWTFAVKINQINLSTIIFFKGASSAPQITLSLPDACRDYQFRVLVVLRATNPREQLIVFRPKPIAPQFPAFVVPKESVRLGNSFKCLSLIRFTWTDPSSQVMDKLCTFLSVGSIRMAMKTAIFMAIPRQRPTQSDAKHPKTV